MNTRRRRALGSALCAAMVAAMCALLSANVNGFQRAALLVLTVAWLAIAVICIARTIRTEQPIPAAGVEESESTNVST